MDEVGQCLFGTAGWSYGDWRGTVYPEPQPAGFNHLQFLARSFDFVEVNTSFYRIPSLRLTSGWVRKSESLSGFSFWVKVYQNFTHKLEMDQENVRLFKDSLEPLRKAQKLSGLLAQFPYSFKLNSPNLDYLRTLADSFFKFPLAVEFRHRSWDREEVLEFFKENNLIWTNIDQPVISYSLPLTDYLTQPEVSYFRLHGRNYQSWFSSEGRDARYDYLYSVKELTQIAGKIKRLKKMAKQIFVSGNNHYKGNAVKNLKQLKEILYP